MDEEGKTLSPEKYQVYLALRGRGVSMSRAYYAAMAGRISTQAIEVASDQMLHLLVEVLQGPSQEEVDEAIASIRRSVDG